jgi:hypothetical protein
MTEAQKLVQQELELEEWGTEAQVKVCFLHGAHRSTSVFTQYSNTHFMSTVGKSSH